MESSSPGSIPVRNHVGNPPKLLDKVGARMRRLRMALRSEQGCTGWIRRFILANGKRHPRDMGIGKSSGSYRAWRRSGMSRRVHALPICRALIEF